MLANFQIVEILSFQKILEKNLGHDAQKIYSKMVVQIFPQLKQNPYYGPNIKKLHDQKPESWRYRIGDYRLFYRINAEQKLVILFSICHRQSAYHQ